MARSISYREASTFLTGNNATQAGNLSGRPSQILLSSSLATRGEVSSISAAGNCLNWLIGESEHLLIVRPSVHHSDTCLDVIKHRNAGYPPDHVASAGCQ